MPDLTAQELTTAEPSIVWANIKKLAVKVRRSNRVMVGVRKGTPTTQCFGYYRI